MVLWIGVDDTDSLQGMCTTFLATEIVRDLTRDHDLIGYPRLVRLNPSIPWKTRGNGAVCIRVGQGRGRGSCVGQIDGRPVVSYLRGDLLDSAESVLKRVVFVTKRWASFGDPETNPGIVVLRERPSARLYRRAVQDVVPLAAVESWLPGRGAWRGFKNRRGLIGAAAATAWRPRDKTFEIVAYRHPDFWGTTRQVDPESVLDMDAKFTSTFNNIDRPTNHVALAPHSPCPVLYGIRGEDPGELPSAMATLRDELPWRWMLFESNQGTDDHIRMNDWSLARYSSTSVEVQIVTPGRSLPGGHVIVGAMGKRILDLAFYEPSKDFRRIAAQLRPGDRVRVWGSQRDDGKSLNVEKLRVDALAPDRIRIGNPVCPSCGKRMKSMGRGHSFRCVRHHARAPSAAGTWIDVARELRPGWYEPPAFARRHLSKPVQRIRMNAITSSVRQPDEPRETASSTARWHPSLESVSFVRSRTPSDSVG